MAIYLNISTTLDKGNPNASKLDSLTVTIASTVSTSKIAKTSLKSKIVIKLLILTRHEK